MVARIHFENVRFYFKIDPKFTYKLALKVKDLNNSTIFVKFQKVPMVLVEDSEYKHVTIGLKKKSSNTVVQTQTSI